MKKFLLFLIVLLIFLISGRLFYNEHTYRYCFDYGYDLQYITGTIQTIGRKKQNRHTWLLRGNIKKFYTSKNYIIGYLSTKYFKEDKLLGLEGNNDKEGYFIVNLKTEKIESGLNEEDFNEKVHKVLGIKSSEIQYKYFPSFSLSCLLK